MDGVGTNEAAAPEEGTAAAEDVPAEVPRKGFRNAPAFEPPWRSSEYCAKSCEGFIAVATDGSKLDVGADGGSLVGVWLPTADEDCFDARESDVGVAGRSELRATPPAASDEGGPSDSCCCFPPLSFFLTAVDCVVISQSDGLRTTG
jgi:hypothetical protein